MRKPARDPANIRVAETPSSPPAAAPRPSIPHPSVPGCPQPSRQPGLQLSLWKAKTILVSWLALAGLLLALAAGCGSSPTPTPVPPPDPAAVLRRAVERVMSLESGAFTLEHREGSTELLPMPRVLMTKVYGEADIPDRFSFTVEAQVSGTYAEVDVVVIEDRAYMTKFFSREKEWQEVSLELVPFRFANLGQTLADIMEAVQEPTHVGAESLKDYTTHRIRGRVKSDDLAALVPRAGAGFDVDLDIWVDQEGGLLLQVLITGQVIATDDPNAVRALTLDDIDIPVEINPPEIGPPFQ